MRANRTESATRRMLALPAKQHPIWTLGHSQVALAHAVCSAFLALRGGL